MESYRIWESLLEKIGSAFCLVGSVDAVAASWRTLVPVGAGKGASGSSGFNFPTLRVHVLT